MGCHGPQQAAVTLAAALALGAAGCAGPNALMTRWADSSATAKFKQAVTDQTPAVTADAAPAPPQVSGALATDFACAWQTRPAQLPDPSKGGAMCPGLAGQAFLYTADMKPADPKGQLSVTATPADPGSTAVPEMWHFTPDVLKRMVVNDDRFGRSVALFLPWPAGWQNVTRLTIQARYDQPDGTTLYAQPTTVTLDLSNPIGGPGGTPWAKAMNPMPGVPDPRVMIQQAKFAAPTAGGNGVIQASAGWPQMPMPRTQQQQMQLPGMQQQMPLPQMQQPQMPLSQMQQPQMPQATMPTNVQMQWTGDGDGTRVVIPRR